jgi:hypothetical protein
MANICITINNIEVSSYGELKVGEVQPVLGAQPQKGDAPLPTNVVVSLSINKSSTIGNVHELNQVVQA